MEEKLNLPTGNVMLVLKHTEDRVVFEFIPPAEFLSLTKEEAINLANMILVKASTL